MDSPEDIACESERQTVIKGAVAELGANFRQIEMRKVDLEDETGQTYKNAGVLGFVSWVYDQSYRRAYNRPLKPFREKNGPARSALEKIIEESIHLREVLTVDGMTVKYSSSFSEESQILLEQLIKDTFDLRLIPAGN